MANDVRINFCFEPIVSAVEKVIIERRIYEAGFRIHYLLSFQFLADTSVIEGDKKYCLLEHLFGLAEAIVSTKSELLSYIC